MDHRRLNQLRVKDENPLSSIGELFDQLGRSIFCSKIDLRSGYHQLKIQEEDILKLCLELTMEILSF